MTPGNVSGILKGQFRFSSEAIHSHLMKTLNVYIYHKCSPAHWSRGGAAGGGGGGGGGCESGREDAWSRNNNSSPSPLWIPARTRERSSGRELEQHSAKHNREPADQISPPRRAFPRDPDPPCSCHFSCYRTSVTRQRRCPCAGRGWFTNISGEYNYTAPPGRAALCGFRREQRRGGGGGGGAGGQRTLKTAFQTLFFPFPEHHTVSALWFRNATFTQEVKLDATARTCYVFHGTVRVHVTAVTRTNSSPASSSTL